MQSITDLIKTSKGQVKEESVQETFLEQEKKIRIESIEKKTAQRALILGMPYVNLFGFPISPDALILISKKDSKKLKAVCFYYDGEQIRIGSMDPQNKELIK